MDQLLALDTGLFRFINQSLSNPLFDRLMPWLSDKTFFFAVGALMAAILLWRWRARGLACLILVLIAVVFGDGVVSKNLKRAAARERPWSAMSETKLRIGKGDAMASMPSSHSVNWFAATMVLFLFDRRTLRIMLPLAAAVAFSRIYNGVHYPADVLVGAVLGAGEAVALAVGLNFVWRWVGRAWFPLWWRKFPSLVSRSDAVPTAVDVELSPEVRRAELNRHWVRAGIVLIVLLTLFRWSYLAAGVIELSEDEAYQWLWSKHLDLSYYSKPPLIAYTQFLGTSMFGDTELGVRFFSPLLAGVMGFLMLRFFTRELDGRTGFFFVLILNTAPFLALGSILMTVDPLSVFFWTAAMLAGWRAIREQSTTGDWLWVGLWMGFGFLSKYTGLFQWLSWAIFFLLWPPARPHLRRAGPYLALLVNAVCALPVIIWNAQHGWPTIAHVATNAKLNKAWNFSLKPFFEFIGGEFGLLNPIFFIGVVIAAIAFFRRYRNDRRLAYFFSMGAPLFLVYLLWTLRARVQLNWIAPAILPLFCLMVFYWHRRWSEGLRAVKIWLTTGLVLGFVAVGFMHETDFIRKLFGSPLPVKMDPMRRVRGGKEMAKTVGQARTKLLAEGKPVFIIGDHYGMAGFASFYLKEARREVRNPPLAYCEATDHPKDQFFFWPSYVSRNTNAPSPRAGQNAIYFGETKLAKDGYGGIPEPIPERLKQQFETVTDLGLIEIKYRGRVFHIIQLFECRNLY